MSTDRRTIAYVANLAALHLTEEEEVMYSQDLDAIMMYMEQLKAIDTSNIEPMEHVLSIRNTLRDDIVKNTDTRDLLLTVAPKTEEGCYLVPNVVE